ncbi:MAG: hypothetical protein EAX90_12875 [Candidatus Heimdallarchaeota archaeon]|nr:hypothetical protein [Candidatus Heimdallarchaeota archaeon]
MTHNDSVPNILNKKYRWSWFTFTIDLMSFTMLTSIICLLMMMHRNTDPEITYEIWVVVVVGVSLELMFGGFAYWDSMRENPKERLYGARIFNMPVFSLVILIVIIIAWGIPEQNALVYGSICGGFAGYLAGGLVYANFFIKIKDEIYRIFFGGLIGTFLGAIFGALFAYLVDPFGGGLFGGIFMGFWGGAVVSGPIATILLFVLRNNEKFTKSFTKMMLVDVHMEIQKDLVEYFKIDTDEKSSTSDLKLELDNAYILTEHGEMELPHFLEVLIKIAFFINPWEKDREASRIATFNEILDDVIEKLGLVRVENTISTS